MPAPIINGGGDSPQNGRISDYHGLVTLTLTSDRVILYIIMITRRPTYQISLKSKKLFVDGRTDGHLRPTNVIRPTRRSRPKKLNKSIGGQTDTGLEHMIYRAMHMRRRRAVKAGSVMLGSNVTAVCCQREDVITIIIVLPRAVSSFNGCSKQSSKGKENVRKFARAPDKPLMSFALSSLALDTITVMHSAVG